MPIRTATLVNSSVFIIDRIETSTSESHEHGLLTQLGVYDDDNFRWLVNTVRASPTNLPVDNSRPGGLAAWRRPSLDCSTSKLPAASAS